MDLGCFQRQSLVIVLYQVPGVTCQFSFHLLQETGWAKDVKGLLAPQKSTEQGVKAYEMIHMCMGDESVCELQNFLGGKAVEVSHIKEKGTFFKKEGNKKDWVFQWGINESGMEGRPHLRTNLAT